MMQKSKKIIIVGVGWTGLAAAVTLAQHGIDVTLLEESSKEGDSGSAPLSVNNKPYDHQEPVLMGFYPKTQALLESIGITESQSFAKHPFRLWVESQNEGIDLKLNNLIFPMNLMVALISAEGLSNTDQKAALKFYRALMTLNFEIQEDLSIEALLLEYRQPQSLIEHLWAPLSRLILNTPIEEASAQVFLKALKRIFGTSDKPLHFLFPKKHLSDLCLKPLLDYLLKKKINIHYNESVQSILIEQGVCQGIQTASRFFEANEIILAIPPQRTAALLLPQLATYSELSDCYQKLQKFHYEPMTTVYLELDKPLNLPYPILGLAEQTGHWLFDGAIRSQPNIASFAIIGKGEHLTLHPEVLATILYQELKQKFPRTGELKHFQVHIEHEAFIASHVGIDQHRPLAQLPIQGITLAGNYMQAGYSDSIETRLESGIIAAESHIKAWSIETTSESTQQTVI